MMTPEKLTQRLRSWPSPRGWPPIVQKLTNEETGQELQPSRRRAWLLWRIVAAQLARNYLLTDASDDFDIGQAIKEGSLRVMEYSVRSAAGERLRPTDVRRRDISKAFTEAMFGVQAARWAIH